MRIALISFALFSAAVVTVVLHPQPANAVIAWSEYRMRPVTERAGIDASITSMVATVGKTDAGGFKTKRIHFCARDQFIWETSIHASCATTFDAAHKVAWPPPLTAESTSFVWIAYLRFATAFCDDEPSAEVCRRLDLTSHSRKTSWLRLFDFLIPPAHADASYDMTTTTAESPPAVPCKIENNVMTTKAGHKIFLDFGVQPAEKHASLLHATAAMAASDKTTDIAVQDNLGQLKAMGTVIVANYRKKKPWVLDRIKFDQVTWIGTEQAANELGPRGGLDYAAAYDKLSAQLQSRRTTKNLTDDAMISGACPSASVCVWLQDRNARSKVQLVPLETESGKMKTLTVLQDVNRIHGELDLLVANGKITKAELGFIKREYTNLLSAETPPDPKEREKLKRRYGMAEVSAAVAGFYDSSVALKNSLSERERQIVDVALAQTSNGILAVGIAHKTTLIPLLESVCENPHPAPPPAAKVPARAKAKSPVRR